MDICLNLRMGGTLYTNFLDFDDDYVAVLKASVRYRAMGLALGFVMIDILVEVVRRIYAEKSEPLIVRVQGTSSLDRSRKCFLTVQKIAKISKLDDLQKIGSFLQ